MGTLSSGFGKDSQMKNDLDTKTKHPVIEIEWEDPEGDLIAAVRQIQEVLDYLFERSQEWKKRMLRKW